VKTITLCEAREKERAAENKGKAPADRAENDSGEYYIAVANRDSLPPGASARKRQQPALPCEQRADHIKARRSSSPLFMICFGAKNHQRRRRARGEPRAAV